VASARRKILVVDDEPAITSLLSEFLVEQGLDVITAGGGREALMRLEIDKPDAICLDVRMPDMDGIQTLRHIHDRGTGTPVLMISANDDLPVTKEALALGAFDYALKPIDFAYLSRTVEKMLASARPAGASETEPERPASTEAVLYDLAMQVFRATRAMPAVAREALGVQLEHSALGMVQRSTGTEKTELVRSLNHLRTLARFAKDLGDVSDDGYRAVESLIVKARRSMGLI
jgi:two-component system response regulator AtoC